MSTLKTLVLKTDKYDLWSMRMEQYLTFTDHAIWEVIVNGDSVLPVGAEGHIPPKTAKQKLVRKNELKAKDTLMLAIPDEHLLKFHACKDAKSQWEAIKNRFQKLISQLEIHGELISQEDANLKLLRSLPSAWNNIALIMRNKSDLDTLSMDDLYNNLKVYESEIKSQSSSSSNFQNVAFVSLNNSSSTNETVNTTHSVSAASFKDQDSTASYADDVMFSFFSNQSNSSQLENEDLEHIDTDDLEEMDLKWQMAMLTMRVNRFLKKTERKLDLNGKETVGFDMTNVECYNCHRRDTSTTNALVMQDGIGGYDWSFQAEEELTNFSLMAYTSYGLSSSDSELENALKEKVDLKLKLEKFETSSKNLTKPLNSQISDIDKTGLGYDGHVNESEVLNNVVDICESDGMIIKERLLVQKEIRPVWDNTARVNHQNKLTHPHPKRNFVPTAILAKSGQVPVNAAKQSSHTAATSVSAARVVNTVASRPNVNNASPTTYYYFKAHSPIIKKLMVDLLHLEEMLKEDETPEILKNFIACIENQMGHKIKTIRCDNVTEFKNRIINEFCEMKGIRREFSVARTPQQNGVAKRKNRTLIEAAKTILADSKLPTTFWAEAVNTACYVQNRVLVIKPHNKTPYELLLAKTNNFNEKFNTAKVNNVTIDGPTAVVSAAEGNRNNVVNALFTDTRCVVLSPDFKLLDESQVLLKVPRNNNMHSFDLKNVVPVGGLTCLFAKATLDESKLWHRRLGHINFKTMNKLARRNLVRGLPSKLFENDHTRVACQKGKQHKASYQLGKFDGKSDDGLFVGYSINSKAFRVFNTRTRFVEENMHITFLENKSNVARIGPNWMFDIDILTMSMNYQSVFARNHTNGNAAKEGDKNDQENDVRDQEEALRKQFKQEFERLFGQGEDANTNSTNRLNTISSPVNTISSSFTTVDPGREVTQRNEFESMFGQNKDAILPNLDLHTDSLMRDLEDTIDTKIFNGAYDDEVEGSKADFNNLELTIVVSHIPTTRIHKDHLKEQIIGDPLLALQTRRMTKTLKNMLRIEAIKLFLAYASFMRFILYHMDVKSAFMYGIIEEELYVCQPFGFEDPHFSNKVYKVEKALYGLHQALGACQDKYVADILKKFDFSSVKTASTPIETNKALLKDEKAKDVDVHLYRSMIGSLMHLTAFKPDIMFVVCTCDRFQVTPKVSHLHVVKRIFRYLKCQPKLGLWYTRDSLFDLKAFLDSDYARASLDRKFTTGGCQFFRKRLILWQCKKQTVVANSTTEAEYVAATNCCGQQKLVLLAKVSTAELKLVLNGCLDWNETAANDEIQVSTVGLTYYWFSKAFWQSTTTHTLDNGEIEITATIDGKVMVVTEASVRRHLKLEDSDGISILPTAEIFEQLALMGNMKRASKGYTGVDIPFFPTMIVQGLIFQDEVASTGVDVRHGGAATTVTSLDAGQGSGNIDKTPSMPYDSPIPRVNTLRSDEGSMTLQELTVKKLENTVKTSQARRKAKIVVSDEEVDLEDPFKQGRSMTEKIDQDVEVALVTPTQVNTQREAYSQEDQLKNQLRVLSAAKVLVDTARRNVQTYTRRRAFSTGSGRISTASRIISTAKESVSTAGTSMPVGTADMIDKAVKLQKEFDEEERKMIARVHEAAQTFTEEEYENTRARVEADEELTQRLQVEKRNKYSEVDQAKMLVDLINQRKRHFAKQKAEAKRKKPMTQAQQRTYMSNYIKHMGSYTLKQLKKLSFDEIKELFKATMRV
nr:putative ribonuclease H-like domain-containing protein [Tanacetum cinerariifolium]